MLHHNQLSSKVLYTSLFQSFNNPK